jgi:hypothetical protein
VADDNTDDDVPDYGDAVRPRGRPTAFKPEFVEQAEKLTKLGATDREIGSFFGVDERTITRWKHDNPAFLSALKRGKDVADKLVEKSLFRRATGYSHDAVKIMQDEGIPVIVPYVEHLPPDTTACIFWLKNRKPKEWRDKIELEGEVRHFLLEVPAEATNSDEWAKS